MKKRTWLNTFAVAITATLMIAAGVPAADASNSAEVTWSQYDVTSPSDILGGAAGVLPGSAKAVDSASTLNGIRYTLLPAATTLPNTQ